MTSVDEIIKQHIAWIASYCACATDENWADILDRIEHQVIIAKQDAKNATD